MLKLKYALITIVVALLLGCQQKEAGTQALQATPVKSDLQVVKQEAPVKLKEKKMTLDYKGTVQYFALEGGFFGIITHKGEKLLPMNLAKEYHQDGAIIEFSGNYKEGMMTIQQWGKPFTITEIKLIKAGKSKSAGLSEM